VRFVVVTTELTRRRRSMIKALSKLDVITLFVEDLSESKKFYTEVFGPMPWALGV
jgi:hypothetical protein